jgi:hypothetical protein
MRRGHLVLVLGAVGLTACGSAGDREWMKVGAPYTTAEFRRDHAECSKGGKLDEDCMKRRGWVSVKARPEKKPEPERPIYTR